MRIQATARSISYNTRMQGTKYSRKVCRRFFVSHAHPFPSQDILNISSDSRQPSTSSCGSSLPASAIAEHCSIHDSAPSLVNNHMERQPLWSVDVCQLIDQLAGFPQQNQTDLDSFILAPVATGFHCAGEYSIGKFVHTYFLKAARNVPHEPGGFQFRLEAAGPVS